jgi:hypothetical protein
MPKGLTDAIEKAADRAVTEEGIRLDQELLGDPDDRPVERPKGGLGRRFGGGYLKIPTEADKREAQTQRLNNALRRGAEEYEDAERVRLGGPAAPSRLQQVYEAIMAKLDDKEED